MIKRLTTRELRGAGRFGECRVQAASQSVQPVPICEGYGAASKGWKGTRRAMLPSARDGKEFEQICSVGRTLPSALKIASIYLRKFVNGDKVDSQSQTAANANSLIHFFAEQSVRSPFEKTLRTRMIKDENHASLRSLRKTSSKHLHSSIQPLKTQKNQNGKWPLSSTPQNRVE